MTNSPPKTSGKLALVLQFWDGDRDAAFRNALRIADNEPTFRKDVEFVFVSRFDSLLDKEVVAKVAKKFKTSSFHCTRKGTGWPSGCNDMWADWVCTGAMGKIFSHEWDDVKAMFTFEADAIPVHTDWIDQLSAEWDRAAEKGKYIVGCFMPPPQNGPVGHINGNALFAPPAVVRPRVQPRGRLGRRARGPVRAPLVPDAADHELLSGGQRGREAHPPGGRGRSHPGRDPWGERSVGRAVCRLGPEKIADTPFQSLSRSGAALPGQRPYSSLVGGSGTYPRCGYEDSQSMSGSGHPHPLRVPLLPEQPTTHSRDDGADSIHGFQFR